METEAREPIRNATEKYIGSDRCEVKCHESTKKCTQSIFLGQRNVAERLLTRGHVRSGYWNVGHSKGHEIGRASCRERVFRAV